MLSGYVTVVQLADAFVVIAPVPPITEEQRSRLQLLAAEAMTQVLRQVMDGMPPPQS